MKNLFVIFIFQINLMEVDHSDEEEDFDLNRGVHFLELILFVIFLILIYSNFFFKFYLLFLELPLIEVGPPPEVFKEADRSLPRLVISKIVTENFKSYAGTTTLGPFDTVLFKQFLFGLYFKSYRN